MPSMGTTTLKTSKGKGRWVIYEMTVNTTVHTEGWAKDERQNLKGRYSPRVPGVEIKLYKRTIRAHRAARHVWGHVVRRWETEVAK